MPEIFEPAKLGPLTLRNRIIKAATFEGRTPDALVSDDLIEFHRAVAAGGAAMTTVAYCAVAPEGRTERRQIYMRPEAAPGLAKLAEAVHAEGAAISAQIGHAGPVADARSNGAPALAASRRLSPLTGRFIQQATEDDIARITAAHADAAELAADSGFDAVELHFGHNYLVSSFLSPKLNKRRDGWGGSVANRAKIARRIAEAVRTRVGDRIAVTAKLNMEDGVRGGLTIDDSLQVARLLESDGHLDALQLTAGSSLLNPMYLFRGEAPVKEFADAFPQPLRTGLRLFGRFFLHSYPYQPGYLQESAKLFRRELSMPLILLGGITDYAAMSRAMDDGFDFVAMGRALLMEPDLVKRIEQDKSTVSQCIHCNRCMPTIYRRTRCVLVES
ncbi:MULTISPECIES: NADH:flavin oxidoreductase [Thermomonospora]|uniref:NADH:flavin oxidoreductase/NADH oxidase n=1 Tax=Thermomonospora curvata (strain ATCC 19995 / DSM 43183 / JCM 3096 / KCTC 9072 / NBRC 15933 / NCIMB 10081 / Henssen B9) TaxID=471852 RepID=D1AE54_THECD|nr:MULTISPECIES: NADH:flavin oxidoreductase [Thermomonospora]ACY99480.1 NADH:flavin oxidoreductase/NADH oxidase [Thermomonospora curvata DSM 43183]PKK12526.1 MAG: NADH:flavin oxidoreductase [Thermomonospora sp. CIF 1]